MPLTASVEVDRPPADVFAYVTDPSRFSEWQEGVVSGHSDSAGPAKPGDKCVTVRRIGFASRPVASQIDHVEPPRSWRLHGLDGPIRAAVEVSVEPLDDGRRSRVTVDIEFTGHGIGKVLVPLVVVPQGRREMPANMRRLKERLEASSA